MYSSAALAVPAKCTGPSLGVFRFAEELHCLRMTIGWLGTIQNAFLVQEGIPSNYRFACYTAANPEFRNN